MITALYRDHCTIGTRDRRCHECDAFAEPERWSERAQPMGTCGRVNWIVVIRGKTYSCMVHADDVCRKFVSAARTQDEWDERAVRAGLG